MYYRGPDSQAYWLREHDTPRLDATRLLRWLPTFVSTSILYALTLPSEIGNQASIALLEMYSSRLSLDTYFSFASILYLQSIYQVQKEKSIHKPYQRIRIKFTESLGRYCHMILVINLPANISSINRSTLFAIFVNNIPQKTKVQQVTQL